MSAKPAPLPTLSAPEGGVITRAQVKFLALIRPAGTVTAFARAHGMQPTTARILLAGGKPKASTIAKLAPYGISPADWFEPALPSDVDQPTSALSIETDDEVELDAANAESF